MECRFNTRKEGKKQLMSRAKNCPNIFTNTRKENN